MSEKNQDLPKRLYRSNTDRVIAGVCGGASNYFAIDATVVRFIWVAFVLFGGVGLLAYIAAWIIIPGDPDSINHEKKHHKRGGATFIWGALLVLIGFAFLVESVNWFRYDPFHFNWHHGWLLDNGVEHALPILIIIIGVYLVIKHLKTGKTSEPVKEKSGVISMENKLTRSTDEKMIAGVCGGLATHFNIDPSLVRVGFVLVSLATGGFLGIIAYVAMMIIVPEEKVVFAEKTDSAQKTKTAPKAKSAKTSGSSSTSSEGKE